MTMDRPEFPLTITWSISGRWETVSDVLGMETNIEEIDTTKGDAEVRDRHGRLVNLRICTLNTELFELAEGDAPTEASKLPLQTRPSEMHLAVVRRANQLRELDIESIKSLPAVSPEALIPDKRMKFAVYHDLTPAGEHRVTVQGVRRWFGLMNTVEVEGFVVAADGTRRALNSLERGPRA